MHISVLSIVAFMCVFCVHARVVYPFFLVFVQGGHDHGDVVDGVDGDLSLSLSLFVCMCECANRHMCVYYTALCLYPIVLTYLCSQEMPSKVHRSCILGGVYFFSRTGEISVILETLSLSVSLPLSTPLLPCNSTQHPATMCPRLTGSSVSPCRGRAVLSFPLLNVPSLPYDPALQSLTVRVAHTHTHSHTHTHTQADTHTHTHTHNHRKEGHRRMSRGEPTPVRVNRDMCCCWVAKQRNEVSLELVWW